jgi:hypothetical protein
VRRRVAAAALLAVLSALAAPPAAVAEVRGSATLVPDPVGLDELALLTLSVESDGLSLPELDPQFELVNLEAVGPPSSSRSHSWVNGATRSRLELVWRLRPLATGAAEVRALRFTVEGRTGRGEDLSVQVVERAPAHRRGQRPATPADPFGGIFGEGAGDPFAPFRRRGATALPGAAPTVRLIADAAPRAIYVGEQTVWRLSLETQTDITGLDLREQPDFSGFWSRPLELPERPVQEEALVDGQRGARFTLVARALFPLREGTWQIGPARAQVAARNVSQGLFGLIGRDVARQLEAPATSVAVRPLPPGAPAGFGGLVGRLAVDTGLDPARVEAGAAATLRVEISGDANFEGAPPPELRLPAGLRAFAPERELTERRLGPRLESDLTWRWVVVADRPGLHPVPPVRVVSFDPGAGEYRVATTRPLTLEVVPATATPALAAAEPIGGTPPAAAGSRLVSRPATRLALWGGLLLAALIGVALLVARVRDRPGSPARGLRQRIDAANDPAAPRESAKALEAVWREHLRSRYGVEAPTRPADWPRALASSGVPAAAAEELVALFEDLHLLALAPELADAEALREDLHRRSRALARRLR